MTATEDFTPHPAVHRPWSFLCGEDGCDVAFAENPATQIASSLLEDIGDWNHAIKNLQRAAVPPPVAAALEQLHEAVCGWTDWNDQQATRRPVASPATPTRPRPGGAA